MLLFAAALAAHSLQSDARTFFANQTVNPSATQFRNVRQVGDVVCGEVNRPNRQGGYDGFLRFVFGSSRHWALQLAGGYRMSDDGKFVDTSFLIVEASYRPGMTTDELTKAADLLKQANMASEIAKNMLQPCL